MRSLFKTPKPRQFHYEPRYYDPKKEEREAREQRIKSELGIAEEGKVYKPYIAKGEFRKARMEGKFSKNPIRKKSNTQILIYIALLVILFYFILK